MLKSFCFYFLCIFQKPEYFTKWTEKWTCMHVKDSLYKCNVPLQLAEGISVSQLFFASGVWTILFYFFVVT